MSGRFCSSGVPCFCSPLLSQPMFLLKFLRLVWLDVLPENTEWAEER